MDIFDRRAKRPRRAKRGRGWDLHIMDCRFMVVPFCIFTRERRTNSVYEYVFGDITGCYSYSANRLGGCFQIHRWPGSPPLHKVGAKKILMEDIEQCSIPFKRTDFGGSRHLVGFVALFNVSTIIILHPRYAREGSRPPVWSSRLPPSSTNAAPD